MPVFLWDLGLFTFCSNSVIVLSCVLTFVCRGYLASRSDLEHYQTERARETLEVQEVPEDEEQEILDIMAPYGLDRVTVQPIIEKLRANPDKFVDFMMRFELNLEAPDPKRSFVSVLATVDGIVGKKSFSL